MNTLQNLFLAYCISTFVFLISAIFSTHLQKVKPTYLSIANMLAAVNAFIVAVRLIIDLRNAWLSDTTHAFYHYRSAVSLKIIIIYLAISLLTFIPKLRRNVFFTLLLIFIYSVSVFIEPIYFFITQYFRDALPSSWAYYNDYSYLYLFIYAGLYFIICYFIAAKMRIVSKSSIK